MTRVATTGRPTRRAATPAFLASSMFLLTILAGTGMAAEEQKPDAPREMVWEGYLYRDGEQRLQIGWPVVAMGVMAQPDHIISGGIVERLTPLVSNISGSYVFWNYSLEKKRSAGLDSVPRILVRLRGKVRTEGDSGLGLFSSSGSRIMMSPELETVEFVSEDWLEQWAKVFRLDHSPFAMRFEEDKLSESERAAKLAPKIRKILDKMRACDGPTEAEKKLVASIAPTARIVSRHRLRTEWSLRNWIVEADRKHSLGLRDLDKLGSSPPDPFETQKLFLAAADRSAFLAAVRAIWDGDLEHVRLAYYAKDGASTQMCNDNVKSVAEVWTDALFEEHRKTTRDMIDR